MFKREIHKCVQSIHVLQGAQCLMMTGVMACGGSCEPTNFLCKSHSLLSWSISQRVRLVNWLTPYYVLDKCGVAFSWYLPVWSVSAAFFSLCNPTLEEWRVGWAIKTRGCLSKSRINALPHTARQGGGGLKRAGGCVSVFFSFSFCRVLADAHLYNMDWFPPMSWKVRSIF